MTSQQIVAMYRDDFKLPVCDDEPRIKQEIQAQKPRRLKETKNTDPRVRSKADEWFKNATLLQDQKQRAKLLRIVYEDWANQADLCLMGARHSGTKTLTRPLIDQLHTIAVQSFLVTDALASRFIRDYMDERDVREEGALFPLQPVEQFDAIGQLGKIELRWRLPPNCAHVLITRRQGAGSRAKSRPEEVYRGGGQSWEDSEVKLGVSYTYTACPLDRDGTPGPAKSRSNVFCLGEVQEVQAGWNGQSVRLAWVPPTPDVSVVVFRRTGARPAVRAGPHGWLPVDSTTSQRATVNRGKAGWEDHNVVEGDTYHYLIVADFGLGRFSQGVTCQVAIPKRPPPVTSLTAAFRQDASGICVELKWAAVPERGRMLRYAVVRREGGVAPTFVGKAKKQEVVTVTGQTRWTDHDVRPGKRYTYAIFSQVGDVSSIRGAAASPVDVLPDVTNPSAKTGDGTVELSWEMPTGARVVVRRSLSMPADHRDGERVELTGDNRACDEGLRNGRRYHYLICCIYRPDGKTPCVSRGVRVHAIPEPLPEPIASLQVGSRGREVVCTFPAPHEGHPVVIRSAEEPRFGVGDRSMSSRDLEKLGRRIGLSGPGEALDSHPNVNEPWYTVFTVKGDHAVAGARKACVVFTDVTELRLSASRDGVVARWVWPDGCTAVLVARREDDSPSGPDDPRAVCTTCTKLEYQGAGDKFLDVFEKSETRLRYVVYARAPSKSGRFYAPGDSPGCRAEIHWRRWTELRYRLERAGNDQLRLVWSVDDPSEASNFAGFMLRADEEWVPEKRTSGIELFRWVPGKGRVTGEHHAIVPPEAIRRKRWRRFFCKAMTIDPAQEPTTLIIHPDVSVSNREILLSRRKPKPNVWNHRAPSHVICPQCFETFPVERMLFGSYEGDEPKPGKRSLSDRLRGRPPRPPSPKLTRKLCPQRHDLPWSAALQKSLFVGLIGAASSGKSHYVAALVERLQGQAGGDLSAAMIHCTDETPRRYEREFYNPLFGNLQELPKTVGEPPPLIYDLTFDGRLWGERKNRAVTLTLYDTAGENFNDMATVRRTLQYLRVASGVIFLVDALQIPAVREIVPKSVPKPPLDRHAQPVRIIGNVLQMLENGAVLTDTEKFQVPVAVVLTKCDVLRDAGLIDLNRLWNVDRRHIEGFDEEIHEDITGMMGEWMYRWCPDAYTTVVRRFARYAFFGVSATGCAPDSQTRRYRFVSPWRVEDPLIWVLAEMGVIPRR